MRRGSRNPISHQCSFKSACQLLVYFSDVRSDLDDVMLTIYRPEAYAKIGEHICGAYKANPPAGCGCGSLTPPDMAKMP